MKSSLTDKNTKWLKFVKTLPEIEKKEVAIGVQADAVDEETGEYIAVRALYNELGTDRIPARPFISSTSDERRNDWWEKFEQGLNKALYGNASNDAPFELSGLLAQRDIQNKIRDIKTPPLAQSTIDLKGSSDPLIDTGQMRQSVRYEVRKAGTNV
jgi:hypothetical protein